jgi:uncharacterized membrane protein
MKFTGFERRIDSAIEHGETEEQVIADLERPKDFAENMEKRLVSIERNIGKRRKKLLSFVVHVALRFLPYRSFDSPKFHAS